jgi:uncharacterized protein YcfL
MRHNQGGFMKYLILVLSALMVTGCGSKEADVVEVTRQPQENRFAKMQAEAIKADNEAAKQVTVYPVEGHKDLRVIIYMNKGSVRHCFIVTPPAMPATISCPDSPDS